MEYHEQIKVGADPEFFLLDEAKINISAHDIVPGTKKDPFPLKHGALQADGTAVEFNVLPSRTRGEFSDNITSILDEIRGRVPKELTFDFSPSVQYPENYFNELPTLSKELGCDPDVNVDGKLNMPNPPEKGTWRTGAGHLHTGWGEDLLDNVDHAEDCRRYIENLDSLWCAFSPAFEFDPFRTRLYGRPGSYRVKPYGVEYRTPSNAWLKYPKLYPFIFELCSYTYHTMLGGNPVPKLRGNIPNKTYDLVAQGGPSFPKNFKEIRYGC